LKHITSILTSAQDLTRLESGNETSLNEAFDLQSAIEDATRVYQNEAGRRKLEFKVDVSNSPKMVVGDIKKIKTVVANLTANARKPNISIYRDPALNLSNKHSEIHYKRLHHRSLPHFR